MTVYPIFGNTNDLLDELRKIGCDEKAVSLFNKKFDTLPIKLIGLKPSMANIIKQEMLSNKGDAVIHSKSVSCEIEKTDVLLLGTPSIYASFLKKMEFQDYPDLLLLARQIKKMLDNIYNRIYSQKTRNQRELDYSKPVVMGILNVTDDSFYDSGRYADAGAALKFAEKMVLDGATIIDIGGESSRPGAESVSPEQELDRVVPLVDKIRKNMDVVISVDTTKAVVAREALKAGADIINDISALSFDPEMASVVKEYKALVVLMHIQGTPKDMQRNPRYEDVVREMIEYFDERLAFAVGEGIEEDKIIIDPGIGFGKNLDHNRTIVKHLSSFRKYGLPVLVGASRKAMIGMILGGQDKKEAIIPPEKRLFGTLGVHAFAYLNGADLFRVHDVKEHVELFKVLQAIK